MVQTDWDRILRVKIDELGAMSSDDIDILCELMANIDDIEEIDAVNKLQHAFSVVQFIMNYKAEESQGLSEDVDEKNKEIKKLKVMKEELEKENAALQRVGGADINVAREARSWEMEREAMSAEIRELKSKYNTLTEENADKDDRLGRMQRQTEQLRDEKIKLEENVEFLRQRANQLKSQREQTQDDNKSELAYTRSELRQKKIDLDNAQERLAECHGEIDRLRDSLEQATLELERVAREYRDMKSQLGESGVDLQGRENECRMLRLQLDHLREQLAERSDTDDKIMAHVNEQVDKWKQIMVERDSEICRLYDENTKLRYDLQKSGINSEKANVQALIKLVKEREQEVKQLSQQLIEATQVIAENGELIANLKKDLDHTGGGSAGHQMRRIKELRQMLDDKEKRIKETVERLETVENQAADREQELADALERNKLYERNEYGLAEAVAEIKATKAQLQVKERQMEQLCQEVNKTNYKVEELKFENGHLRNKLGIPIDEQLDLEGYKRQKAAEDQEERAINIVLQKEIEKLEDERLMMKKKIRVLARQAGLRAGSAGLEAGDALEEYQTIDFEETKIRNRVEEERIQPQFTTARTEAAPTMQTWRIREKEMNRELFEAVKNSEKREIDVARLSARNEELQKESDALQQGLRELKDKMQAGSSVECPDALAKLLAALESKKLLGELDSGAYWKTRIDNLEGRNEELRSELRAARIEVQSSQVTIEKLRQRLKAIEPVELGGDLEPGDFAPLPENLPASAGQTITALNSRLIAVLQEKSLKEDAIDKLDRALENYRRKFALVRHQQGLLYRQYADEKQRFEAEIADLRNKLTNVEGVRAEDNVRIAEFDRLLNTMNQGDSEVQKNLADLTRQVTVLRVNEAALVRRYTAVQDMEQTLRRENNKLKNEMIQIESVVTDRMGYYRRFKETANYKLNVLQKELDDSVPRRDMNKLQTRFDELTEKYRTFLEKQNILIGRGESIIQIENELTKMKMDHEALKKILEAEKQRRHVLEATLEEIEEGSVSDKSKKSTSSPRKGGTSLNNAHLISISKKVTTLEMKEINERERADHAVRMYDSIKHTWNEAEKRNKELEEKLSQLTSANLELQKIERELRDELVDSVSKEISDQQKRKVLGLEKKEMEAKHEIEKLKEIAEIATIQANTLQQQQLSRDKEVISLRQQLLDIQCQTDEKSLIGKLHRHIVQLQLSETSALRKLDDIQRTHKRLEAQLLRTEQNGDEKDQNLYHTRLEARSRVKHLKATINSLRSQFSGSVPLSRQERFTFTLVQLTEEKVKLDRQLQETIHSKFDIETELQSLKLINENQKELKDALRNKKNEKNVLELWNAKMENLRLESLKQKRQTDLLRHEIEHLESVIKCQESQLSQVDEDIARMIKDHDEKQLLWEQRESELERIVENLENIQGEVIIAAHSFQEASGKKEYFGTMPDANAPLPNQLEQAVTTIKKNIRVIFDKENENKSLKKQTKDQESKIRDLEGTLLKRERYINELRLRLPATEERLGQIGSIAEAAAVKVLGEERGNYVDEKTAWAAQTTVASLQERLRAKDETIARFERQLKEARDDLAASNQRHQEELQELRDRLQALQPTSRKAGLVEAPPSARRLTGDQMREMNELRDLLTIEIRKNEDLKRQLGDLEHRLATHRSQWETEERLYQSRLRDADMRTENDILDMKENINNLKKKLSEKDSQLDWQNGEISRLKAEVAKSPSAEVKSENVRLAESVREKDRQLQALKRNLADAKKTIADQSVDALRITRDEMSKQENIQRVVEKQTRDLSNELEALRDQLLQYQRELRAARADKDHLQMELDGLRAEQEHRDALTKKMKGERARMEQDNEDLRAQLQRMKQLRNLSSNDALKQELDTTKVKLHLVEEENNQLRKMNEKPTNMKSDGIDKMALWEDGKKNQKIQDKLREKLSEKENEVTNLGKQLDITVKALDRLRKEKQVLENRLTDKWGPGALLDVDNDIEKITPSQARNNFSAPKKSESIDDLKRRNSDLEKEITRLWKDGGLPENKAADAVALKESEMRNRILQKNIDDLERRLIQSGNATGIGMEKERAMQKELIRLNGENLEMKFELESSRKQIPRLKDKVDDLKKYVELLKAEKEALEGKTNRSLESTASTISNIKRIGDSGKSTKELEKMIARMKKVVEKTQRENERLKEAPGVVMNEQVQLLRSENSNLKQELSTLKEQVGQRLTERYDAKERGMAKVVGDYEKLRKDLSKECEEHEKTKLDMKQLSREVEKLERKNQDLESKLAVAESRSRQNVSRMANNELQEENKRLSAMIDNLQSQLNEKHSQNSDSSKIDELKFRYRKAVERNLFLEKQLKTFSEQFGVAIDLGY